jgi:hypothetical protein
MKLLALVPFLLLIAVSILSSSFSFALNYASLVIDNNQRIIDPEISPCNNTNFATRLHFENGMTESRDRIPNVPALQLISTSGYSTAADIALQSAECFLYRSGWTCFGSFVSNTGQTTDGYYIGNTKVFYTGCNGKSDSNWLVGSSYLRYSIYTSNVPPPTTGGYYPGEYTNPYSTTTPENIVSTSLKCLPLSTLINIFFQPGMTKDRVKTVNIATMTCRGNCPDESSETI